MVLCWVLAFGIGMVLVNRFLERFLNEKYDRTEMLVNRLNPKDNYIMNRY
jgi:hypothetical protein